MARIIKRICFMTIVFLVAISIKVYANELTIDCSDSINPETENTLECVLKGNFTDNVNSIKVRYTLPAGVEFQGFTPAEGWNLEQGGTATTTGLVLRIDNGDVNGEVEFGRFTFNVPSTYSKNKISLKLYELDATNTSCEIVEFSEDEVEKNIMNLKADSNKEDDETDGIKDGENNNPSGNNNGTNDGQGNNDSNKPSGINDNNKNNVGENGNNANTGSASVGIKKDNYNSSQKVVVQKDTTVTKTPFGQYGNGKIIMISIVIVSGIGFIVYRKFKKVKFIK